MCVEFAAIGFAFRRISVTQISIQLNDSLQYMSCVVCLHWNAFAFAIRMNFNFDLMLMSLIHADYVIEIIFSHNA